MKLVTKKAAPMLLPTSLLTKASPQTKSGSFVLMLLQWYLESANSRRI